MTMIYTGKLLTKGNSNPKIGKGSHTGFHAAILHLAPGNMSGYEVCPHRTPGCTLACLHTAGNVQYLPAKEKARISRTKLFFEHREVFIARLMKEIASHVRKCAKIGMNPAIRLNGTSDLRWESIVPELFHKFSNVQFWDYTKDFKRMLNFLDGHLPANLHLTFSESENNSEKAMDVLFRDGNVARVLLGFGISRSPKPFPKNVVDGDQHDFRWLDGKSKIVGLRAKGLAKKDTSGFSKSFSLPVL